ncbi:IS630 family transposase, partial [Streptomyces olivaceoviridis]|uniref:IS630 family transposase n=1 Tax=Streptomyces olivaceoviridis TaxID=1921 RepID=UPI0033E9B762
MSSSAGVPRRGPKLQPLLLADDERAVLERWTRRANSAQALALRARIVLACAGRDIPPIVQVARNLRISADTVRKWRRRFLAERLDGLADEPRPGRPPTIGVDQVEAVVVATLEEIPKNATHWSRKSMAEHSGLSKSTVGRIWRRFQLKPHLTDTFKLSTDPLFVEKVYDVVGLYFNPPEGAVVLSVDEKSQIQ